MKNYAIAYVDGGSRKNISSCAVHFPAMSEQNRYKALSKTTNNEAEYQGLILALETILFMKEEFDGVQIYTDSQLMARQVGGSYAVNAENIKPLWMKVMKMLSEFQSWKVTHIPREENTVADRLCNIAMDEWETQNLVSTK